MHPQHIKTFRLIIRLIVLGLYFAEVEAKAGIIGIPDNSYVNIDGVSDDGNSVDFTNTQISGSRTFESGDFLSGGGVGNVRGSANLATGELRVYADALAGLAGPFGPASIDVFGEVGFGDRVFIDGSWIGDLPVTISLGLSGFYTPNQPETRIQVGLNTASGSGTTAEGLDIFDGATIPLSLTSTVMVPSSFPFFDFAAFAQARASDYVSLIPGAIPGPDAVANFENTARLGITLPSSEFSFRSESTVLLTQSSTSVPEPSTLFLLGSALVGLGVWRWKHAAQPQLIASKQMAVPVMGQPFSEWEANENDTERSARTN